MQFGLDACSKENAYAVYMSAPGNNPRKRVEAKSYRARDRCDNGWYRDDIASATTPQATPVKRFHQECCCRCGGQLSEPSVGGVTPSAAVVTMTPKSAAQAEGRLNRDRMMGYGHPSEWYGTPSKEDVTDSGRARHHDVLNLRKREFYSNSKDWYKHEHTMIVADDEDLENADRGIGKKRMNLLASPSWWPTEGKGTVVQSPRPRLMGSDAERYWQRDHDGSANEWFRHEHAEESRDDVRNGCGSDDVQTELDSGLSQNNVCCSCCHQTVKLQANAEMNQADDKTQCRPRQALGEKFLQAN
jgi:hypothetical protein